MKNMSMKSIRMFLQWKVFLGLFVIVFVIALSAGAAAQQEKVLHAFGAGTDGTGPNGGLISDAAGNLYGTTAGGGIYESENITAGTVFELSQVEGGDWTKTTLHGFGGRSDGAGPSGGLVADAAGNLYGTTAFGGNNGGCVGGPAYQGGCGVVFQLQPPATKDGAWSYQVVYYFQGGTDGAYPYGELVFDAAGNLYGTTAEHGGGWSSAGTVYELSPAAGRWTLTTLHVFNGGKDGDRPMVGVIRDVAGNLYGSTCGGGAFQGGMVFELAPRASVGWGEKVLHNFNSNSTDGSCPGRLTFDSTGNIFGATLGGGSSGSGSGNGTVFELTPSVSGGWREQVLHRFNGASDGSIPETGLIFDAAGNLWGDTTLGGVYNVGTVFELTPSAGGWTEKILHSFSGGSDGMNPSGALFMDSAGDLYGATIGGGVNAGEFGSGTVFVIRP